MSDDPDDDGLRRENERLALTLKALGGGVWDYDLDADVLVCSDRWYAILGLDPVADRVATIAAFQRYIHPDDLAIATGFDLQEVDLLIDRDERYHREFRVIRPDGSIWAVSSVACLVRDPATGHHRAVGCITDATAASRSRSSPDIDGPGFFAADDIGGLSERERECLLWVSVGKTAWETAMILELSRRTVEFHLANAVRKLHAANKVHAAAIAIRNGLL